MAVFLRFFKTLKILYDNLGFTRSKKNFSDLSSHNVKDLGREVNFLNLGQFCVTI